MTEFKIDLTEKQARRLIDHLSATSGVVDKQIAQSLEAQMPVREPSGFGSAVLTRNLGGLDVRYVRSYSAAVDKPWCTGNSHRSWQEILDESSEVKVLRVGLGEPS